MSEAEVRELFSASGEPPPSPDEEAVRLSTTQVRLRLRKRFPAPEYAYFDEIPNGTAGHKSRTLDALAMSVWPSRGLRLIGIEIKASRADWQRELRNPAKAEALFQYCHHFYLAVGDERVVQPGELPPTWGLLIPRGGQLVAKVEAPLIQPQPLTYSFLAAILRRASEVQPEEAALKTRLEAALAEKEREWQSRQPYVVKQLQDELVRLRRSIQAFEEKSGVKIDAWSGAHMGEAVARLYRMQDPAYRERASRIRDSAQRLPETADAELAEIARMDGAP